MFISAYPGAKVIYVLNRLIIKETGKYLDCQLCYLKTNPKHPASLSELVLDDKALPLDRKKSAKSSAILYFEKRDITLGIIIAPLKHEKRKTFMIFQPKKSASCELKIQGFHDKVLEAGDIIEMRYIICWDDGIKIDEYIELEKKIKKGKFNDRFYKLK